MSSTIIVELASLLIVRPHLIANAFQVLAKSCINMIKVAGPFTDPKGMTLYVHYVASGLAKASFAWEAVDTLI